MATIVLVSTFSDPAYTETVNLDGTDYLLTFKFNQRAATWYLSVNLADGTPVASGLALVPNFDLLAKARATIGCPPGTLVVQAYGADDSPPGIGELGAGLRCELLYVTAT